MEAVTGAVTLAQFTLSGVAFLKHIPQIQSEYSELCNEINFIRALCERANEASQRRVNPILPLAKESPILQTKTALEEIVGDLEQIKQRCERSNEAGETAAIKRKWVIKEGEIARLVSKAQKAKMNLGLAMDSEAVVNGHEAIELQTQISTQLGGMGQKMDVMLLSMNKGILHSGLEMSKRQEHLGVQLGEFDRNMDRRLIEMRELWQAIREGTTLPQARGKPARVQEIDDDGNVMNGDEGSTVELSGQQGMRVLGQLVEQNMLMPRRRKRCSYNCRCRCHVKPWRLSSPRWTEQWIGLWELEFRFPQGRREWALDCFCTSANALSLRTLRPCRTIPFARREWIFLKQPADHLRLYFQQGMAVYPDDRDESGVLFAEEWLMQGAADVLEFLLVQWTATLAKQGLRQAARYKLTWRMRADGKKDEKLRRLLEQVASFVDDDGLEQEETPLHNAAMRGSGVQEALDALKIPAIEALEMWDAEGKTPLHYAAIDGHCDAARELVEAGADVNCFDSNKWTPLMTSALSSDVQLMQLLLSTGKTRGGRNKTRCRIDEHDQAGWTALHFAARVVSPSAVRLLLDHGASASVRSSQGYTPLHVAAGFGEEGASPENTEATLRLLLDLGNTDINSLSSYGSTPLALAITNDRLAAVRFLVEAGAAHTVTGNNTRNLLHWAALHCSTSILNYLHLLKLDGVSSRLRDTYGDTPWDAFIYSLRAPHWKLGSIRKPTEEDGQAFAQLFRDMRDRSIRNDLAHLGHALNALSTNDAVAACSSLSELITTKQKCGELEDAKFYRGLEKEIHAGGCTAPITKAIQEVIQDLEFELATDPWEQPTRYDSLGPMIFREPEFYDCENDSIASEESSHSRETPKELEEGSVDPAPGEP